MVECETEEVLEEATPNYCLHSLRFSNLEQKIGLYIQLQKSYIGAQIHSPIYKNLLNPY